MSEMRVQAGGQAATPGYEAKVQAAAEQFEGFFIAQMLRQMRQATREMAGEDSVFRNRVNQDMLDMADVTLADTLAGQRAFGIADAIVRQLLPQMHSTMPGGPPGSLAPSIPAALPLTAAATTPAAMPQDGSAPLPLRSAAAPLPLTGAADLKFAPPTVASHERRAGDESLRGSEANSCP